MFGTALTMGSCLQIASDGLKGRVFEVSLADLQSVSIWHAMLLFYPSGGAHAESTCLSFAE